MLRILVMFVLAFGSTLAHADGDLIRKLNRPVPGGVAVVPVGGAERAPQVSYAGRQVLVQRDSDGRWVAVVGIELKAAKGSHRLLVKDGRGSRNVPFQVGARRYKEQHITLKNKEYVSPDPEQLKRFERERLAQEAAYRSYRNAVPSNVLLDRPVSGGRLSSPFGLRRFFNGEERNPHSGLDFAVPAGTPVRAPADGVVTIVDDYFFNGKTVFIDHGQGLVTMYCHLSAYDVKVGQKIRRGEILGRVGSTGRATGPHLHWNVSLNDHRVDPAIFIGAYRP